MYGMMNSKKLLLLTSIFLSVIVEITAQTNAKTIRYSLCIGANNGGKDRASLKYAASDATSIDQTMRDVGGVKAENSWLLIDPTKQQVEKNIDAISEQIKTDATGDVSKEFFFYYSGHSNEKGLLLGNEVYAFADLKNKIATVPGAIHIVMLDSCYSGNFLTNTDSARMKGGTKRKSFLSDTQSVDAGTVYIASSSGSEVSQESDTIHASYFTSAVVTGLRGAADKSGDMQISLDELYNYAFENTVQFTNKSAIGQQHPGYTMEIKGEQNLVLSDFNTSDSYLILPKDLYGSVLIRNQNGTIAGEVEKRKGTSITLALSAGTYEATITGKKYNQDSYFIMLKGMVYTLETTGRITIPDTGSLQDKVNAASDFASDYIP